MVEIELSVKKLPEAFDGLRIAQLSDFHYGDLCQIPIRKAVDIVKKLKPDLVVLTGDFVTVPMWVRSARDRGSVAQTAGPCARLLREMEAPLGLFAVLGNHDLNANSQIVTELIESNGIPVLLNSSVAIEREGARLWLAGVDDVLEGKPDLERALKGLPGNEPVALLAHEPDFADEAARYSIFLQLSGHSHGGQVWLPGIGAPWLPRLARKYPRGLRKIGDFVLYTNIGLGTIRVPVRLNCPPEVTILKLRSA